MNDIILQLIISGAGIIIAIVSVLGILARKLNNKAGNGCKSLDKEFNAQVKLCNERFIKIAEDSGKVTSSLESIDGRLGRIEESVKK